MHQVFETLTLWNESEGFWSWVGTSIMHFKLFTIVLIYFCFELSGLYARIFFSKIAMLHVSIKVVDYFVEYWSLVIL